LTFAVIGGKSGKIAARNDNDVARWAAKTARFGWMVVVFTLPGVGLHGDEVSIFASP
jgi:hypothetical protein